MHEERTEPRRVEARLGADEGRDYGNTSPSKRRGTYDHSGTVRLDNWSGADRREGYRDRLTIVRAGLATYRMAALHITDAGHPVVQAHVGGGRRIEGGRGALRDAPFFYPTDGNARTRTASGRKKGRKGARGKGATPPSPMGRSGCLNHM